MSVRSSMTMRAFTQRRYQTGIDDYGQPTYSYQSYLTDLPCKAWMPKGGGEHRKYEDKDTLVLKNPRMVCPLGTDISEKDLIEKIEDRRGTQLFGDFTIDSIQQRTDHLDIVLSEVR